MHVTRNADRSLKQVHVKQLFLGSHKTYNRNFLVPSTTHQKKHMI